jgi:type 1 glutamine amidotransferase
MLMAIRYGQGRVFHTTLGHDVAAMQCVGFIVTLQRGAEWAATGRVTLPLPPDFPTATEVRLRRQP